MVNLCLGQGWMDLVNRGEGSKAERRFFKLETFIGCALPSRGRTEFLLRSPPQSDLESDSHDSPAGPSEPERGLTARASTFGQNVADREEHCLVAILSKTCFSTSGNFLHRCKFLEIASGVVLDQTDCQ